MTQSLKELVSLLESRLPELERHRSSNGFANDVFEAADDLCHLGQYVLDSDTRVDYPARVRQELELWNTLKDLLQKKSAEDQQRYRVIFETADQILRFAKNVQPPADGHLGVLRVIREQFGFLKTEYGFRATGQSPTGLRFSSGAVYLELAWAKQWSNSCGFGSESDPKKSFWIKDLLFMHDDQRYRTLPDELMLETENAVENWFKFLASIFKQYGRDVLTNQTGIFQRLTGARAEWDREYIQEMNRLYGTSGPEVRH